MEFILWNRYYNETSTFEASMAIRLLDRAHNKLYNIVTNKFKYLRAEGRGGVTGETEEWTHLR